MTTNSKSGGMRDDAVKVTNYGVQTCLANMFKLTTACEGFLQNLDVLGMRSLAWNLEKNPDDLGLMYYTMLNIWILSFHESSHKFFLKPMKTRDGVPLPLIKRMINVIEIISKEKILRVAFGTFRVDPLFPFLTPFKNLIDANSSTKCTTIAEIMLDCGLFKKVELYINHNLKDDDLKENLETIGKILEKEQKIYTSYEKYMKEIEQVEDGRGQLQWGPIHQDKFWGENVKNFEL